MQASWWHVWAGAPARHCSHATLDGRPGEPEQGEAGLVRPGRSVAGEPYAWALGRIRRERGRVEIGMDRAGYPKPASGLLDET